MTHHQTIKTQLQPQSGHTFSAKEKDDETWYSYFGARYYDSELSVWLSVDPMADKYPDESPYCYVGNRPINTIDPWGMDKIEDPNGNTGEAGAYKQTTDKKYLYGNGMKTLIWNPNKTVTSEGGGTSNIANPMVAGGYDFYDGPSIDFENYGKPVTSTTTSVSFSMPLQNNATPWMDFAKREIGQKEFNPGNNPRILDYLHSAGNSSNSDATAWCASYIHWCLKQANIKGAGPIGNSYLNWGVQVQKPVYGAVAVFKTGHVGFYMGTNTDGTLKILHGNWSNRVKISSGVYDPIYPVSIRQYRMPR